MIMETKKFNEETLTAIVKKKNILLPIEYCIENKIEFIVTPGNGSDEFIIAFVIRDLPAAVALGMSLKDLKIELNGLPSFVPANVIRNNKKPAVAVNAKEEMLSPAEENMLETTLNFDMAQ
jgi:hypothetical protein